MILNDAWSRDGDHERSVVMVTGIQELLGDAGGETTHGHQPLSKLHEYTEQNLTEFCHVHSRARIVTNHVLQILLVFVFLWVPGHDVLVPIVPRRMWPASESEEALFLTWGHDCLNRQDLFILFSGVFCMFSGVICMLFKLSYVASLVSHSCWHIVTRLAVTFFHGSEEEK